MDQVTAQRDAAYADCAALNTQLHFMQQQLDSAQPKINEHEGGKGCEGQPCVKDPGQGCEAQCLSQGTGLSASASDAMAHNTGRGHGCCCR